MYNKIDKTGPHLDVYSICLEKLGVRDMLRRYVANYLDKPDGRKPRRESARESETVG